MKNNNSKVIRRLSNRSLKNNRMRNLFALSAIILTAVLFTSLFTLGYGVMKITEEQTMRQVGTRAHAGLKDVTWEQYEKITAHPLVKKSSFNIFIAEAINKELIKRQTEIRYTEAKNLEFGFAKLKEGRLPIKKDEAVVDTIVMDMLGIPHKLGEKLELQFDFMGKSYQETFTISGWYQGDQIAHASTVYLSKSFFNEISEPYTEEDFLKEKEFNNGVGLYQGNIMFSNSFDIDKKISRVIMESGYSLEDIDVGINWAYFTEMGGEPDLFGSSLLIIIFVIIMFTGYLIIYNIFQISIMSDIRFYGLLKTIGATKKQITHLVLRQAYLLSVLGIPLGLGMGYLAGNLLFPVILSSFSSINLSNYYLQLNPFIFMFAGVFSLLTIFISCRKPGRIAGSVSPIEAVKYTDVSKIRRKLKKTKRGAGLFTMALANLKLNTKKTAITILSLSLSVILMIEVVTFSKSFSMDRYIEGMLTGDFMIHSVGLTNFSGQYNSLALPEDFKEATDIQEGIERSGSLYNSSEENSHILSPQGQERFREFYEADSLRIYEGVYSNRPILEKTLAENYPIHEERYAFDESLLSKLKVLEGELDLEKFRSGRYILVSPCTDQNQSYYKPGDIVNLNYHTTESVHELVYVGNYSDVTWKNDRCKEYEVLAVVDIPYSMTIQRFYPNALTTILPLKEFLDNDMYAECFAKAYWVEDEKEEAFESFLKTYTTRLDPNTDYKSKDVVRKELVSLHNTIDLVGGALSFIVGIVGILNFINTILTGVITRRRELAMLQSIGLTDKQLKWMLIYEGLCYIFLTAFFSITLGSLISLSLIRGLKSFVNYFEYQFTLMPFVILLPCFLVIGIVIPLFAYRNTKKHSIVERLREAE